MLLHVGDRVKMRKAHPCGNDVWQITFVGSDIKMRCEKCSRIVMLERPVFEKRVKKLLESAEAGGENASDLN
ncbi:MAG: DUF951 family protein [Clostridia bacterium]|nr:DUF951 family protein [Clostridia bacterium]